MRSVTLLLLTEINREKVCPVFPGLSLSYLPMDRNTDHLAMRCSAFPTQIDDLGHSQKVR